MAIMQLNVVPLGTKTTSVGEYVADFQKYLVQENIAHTLTDMGTIISGDIQKLLTIAAKIHELPFQKDVQRVVTHIVIDDRRDKKIGIGDKVESVKARLS